MSDRPPSSGSRSEALPPAPESWVRRFGRRNVAYILFVLLTFGGAALFDATGSGVEEASQLVAAAIWFWSIGSIGFFVVNAILLIFTVVRGGSRRKAAIACGLPIGLMVLLVIAAQFASP